MASDDLDRVRKALERYFQRKGFGSKESVARMCGTSPDTIYRFLRGDNVNAQLYVRLQDIVEREGFLTALSAKESASTYSPPNVLCSALCHNCGEMTPEFTYCGHCGQQIRKKCPECGTLNRIHAQYCDSCRASLKPETEAVAIGLTSKNHESPRKRKGKET